MPTPIDRALNSKNALLAFSGIITAVAAWSIWGPGDLFPAVADPKGDPAFWTESELRSWLNARNLMPAGKATRIELVERVQALMKVPPPSST